MYSIVPSSNSISSCGLGWYSLMTSHRLWLVPWDVSLPPPLWLVWCPVPWWPCRPLWLPTRRFLRAPSPSSNSLSPTPRLWSSGLGENKAVHYNRSRNFKRLYEYLTNLWITFRTAEQHIGVPSTEQNISFCKHLTVYNVYHLACDISSVRF